MFQWNIPDSEIANNRIEREREAQSECSELTTTLEDRNPQSQTVSLADMTMVLADGKKKELPLESSLMIVGNCHPSGRGMNGQIYFSEGMGPTLTTNKGEGSKIAIPIYERTE